MLIQNVKGSNTSCGCCLLRLPGLLGGLPKPLSDGHTSKNASTVESGAPFWNQEEGAAKVTGCKKMASKMYYFNKVFEVRVGCDQSMKHK